MTLRPRRILFARAADANNLNAQAKNAQNILRWWKSPEYRPSVFAFSEPDAGVAANPNVDIVRLQDGHLWRAEVFFNYLRRFDAVFYPGIHHLADWLGLRVRAALGTPLTFITTIEGLLSVSPDDEYERSYAAIAGHRVFGQKVPAAVMRRAAWTRRTAAHIIAISPFLGRQARALAGDKVSVLPLGVDTRLFHRAASIRRTRPRVVCAGNVRAHKRPELFLALARHFPGVDFAWFGDGDLRAGLAEQAREEDLGNLTFPGPLPADRLAAEMAASDVFVLPSMGEGVPKVTQEAAAAGLPQVVFGFYEAPTVIDGLNGSVVWSDDEFGARLGQLLADAGLRERMGRAGANMARDWAWEVVAPQWEECIIASVEAAKTAGHHHGRLQRMRSGTTTDR